MQGETNGVFDLLTQVDDSRFIERFWDNYAEIFACTKDEIVHFLEKINEEQVHLLRDHMLNSLVEQFPEYAGKRGLVTRRKKKLLADDVYTIGYSVVSQMEDRR